MDIPNIYICVCVCVCEQVTWLENHVAFKCNSIVNLMYMCMIMQRNPQLTIKENKSKGHDYPKDGKGLNESMNPRCEIQVTQKGLMTRLFSVSLTHALRYFLRIIVVYLSEVFQAISFVLKNIYIDRQVNFKYEACNLIRKIVNFGEYCDENTYFM